MAELAAVLKKRVLSGCSGSVLSPPSSYPVVGLRLNLADFFSVTRPDRETSRVNEGPSERQPFVGKGHGCEGVAGNA